MGTVVRPVGRARGHCQHEPALATLQRRYPPSALERCCLGRFVEIVADAPEHARGDGLSGEVDAKFQDDNAARQRAADVLERRIHTTYLHWRRVGTPHTAELAKSGMAGGVGHGLHRALMRQR